MWGKTVSKELVKQRGRREENAHGQENTKTKEAKGGNPSLKYLIRICFGLRFLIEKVEINTSTTLQLPLTISDC